MKIKEELLKFDRANVFYAISVIYGPHRYADFCNYIKDVYDLDPSYKPVDIIDVMSEDELALNVRVYFDSEDENCFCSKDCFCDYVMLEEASLDDE